MITVDVKGLSELRAKLMRAIPLEAQGRALQGALAAAARPVVRRARSLAPVGATGNLRRSIYSSPSRQSRGPTYQVRAIGVRSGKRRGANDAYYWRFVEFGRGRVEVKSPRVKALGTPAKGFFGRAVRAVSARPFLRPALEQAQMQAIEAFRVELAKRIERAAEKG